MGLFTSIINRFKGTDKIDWEDLEETLIAGDIGIKLTTEIIKDLQERKGRMDASTVVEICREHIRQILGDDLPLPPKQASGMPTVILVAGVNGAGKTTSIAKLAAFFKNRGDSVVLSAADTFRAAAIEQLTIWADRIGVPIVKTHYQGDPSAVCYDAHQKAIHSGADYLICDTAGRLHTRHNLMEELKKIERTLAKQDAAAPHEKWIVVDATTGGNAVIQAREFHAALKLNGLIVTKLDGSGKGGSLVAIRRELGIPARFIGTGEKMEDLQPFQARSFVETLL